VLVQPMRDSAPQDDGSRWLVWSPMGSAMLAAYGRTLSRGRERRLHAERV